MPFGAIGKTLKGALGGNNVGKLLTDSLDKKVMGEIGKTLQGAMGQGGPVDAAMKKALDGIKKVETQGKELAKVATDAEKKGEEAVGDAVDGMKKLVDGQASALSSLQKALQDALSNFDAEGDDEEEGGGKGGKGGKGKGGKGGKGGDKQEVAKKLEEALKKVSGIAKTASASKKEVAKAKKNKGKKGGGGRGRGA